MELVSFITTEAGDESSAEYAEFEITNEITSGVVTGKFPRRALSLVTEWCSLHKAELAADWFLAQSKQPLKTIDPLE